VVAFGEGFMPGTKVPGFYLEARKRLFWVCLLLGLLDSKYFDAFSDLVIRIVSEFNLQHLFEALD
jgi:hypothetical protein